MDRRDAGLDGNLADLRFEEDRQQATEDRDEILEEEWDEKIDQELASAIGRILESGEPDYLFVDEFQDLSTKYWEKGFEDVPKFEKFLKNHSSYDSLDESLFMGDDDPIVFQEALQHLKEEVEKVEYKRQVNKAISLSRVSDMGAAKLSRSLISHYDLGTFEDAEPGLGKNKAIQVAYDEVMHNIAEDKMTLLEKGVQLPASSYMHKVMKQAIKLAGYDYTVVPLPSEWVKENLSGDSKKLVEADRADFEKVADSILEKKDLPSFSTLTERRLLSEAICDDPVDMSHAALLGHSNKR